MAFGILTFGEKILIGVVALGVACSISWCIKIFLKIYCENKKLKEEFKNLTEEKLK